MVSLAWTLGLLFLGSVVHATESSLACPDWPTCFGTMVPVMEGGVFWEHLHRLVAGGLVLLWAAGTWFAFREPGVPTWVKRASIGGLLLLIVQSVFGGLTVLYRLPDAVSTTHLGLAFLFLALATHLSAGTRATDAWSVPSEARRDVRRFAGLAALLVFVQSLLGAAVRHTEAGLACPDIPLCIGEWVPPLDQWPIALHFAHRVLALGIAAYILVGIVNLTRRHGPGIGRPAALLKLAIVLVVAQVALGFLSVYTFLAVVPVSLHTLLAASLLAALVAARTLALARTPDPSQPVRETVPTRV